MTRSSSSSALPALPLQGALCHSLRLSFFEEMELVEGRWGSRNIPKTSQNISLQMVF